MTKESFKFFSWKMLYLYAALLLFVNLGVDSISNSEGRWFAVAQEMLSSGDYLHPTINGQPYFDKPLVSYWFIALAAQCTGGVNGWSARLPSAVAALVALFCTGAVGKRLFGEKAALLGCWVFATVYSFAFWGRLAEADMEQLAFVMAALAVYFRVKEKPGFWGYAAFWSICAAGAQTKGLAAFALPGLAAGIDMLLTKTLTKHLNIRSLAGVIAGGLVYLIPFLLESLLRGTGGASGLMLVFRENVVRAVNPWDHHSDPFWIYFQYLPQLMLPWSVVLIPALLCFLQKLCRKEPLSAGEKYLLLTIAAFFVLFSASRSRRVYYILPLVPFCSMLCGVYLAEGKEDWSAFVVRRLLKIADWLLLAAGSLALLVPFALLESFRERVFGSPAGGPGCYEKVILTLAFSGAVLLLIRLLGRRRHWSSGSRFPEVDRVIPSLSWMLFVVFALLIPPLDADPVLRPTRLFCEGIRQQMEERKIPAENLAFFGRHYRNHVYYLALPRPAKLFGFRKLDDQTRRFTDDSTRCGGPEELAEFLIAARASGGMLMLRLDDLERMQKAHPKIARAIVAAPAQRIEEWLSIPEIFQTTGQKKLKKIRGKKMAVFFYPVPQKEEK